LENPQRSWGHPIGSNRCKIQKRFLQSDADYLLMMDDDIIPYFNPGEFCFADKDIIGFPAKVKQSERALNWVVYQKHPEVEGFGPVDFSRLDSKYDLYDLGEGIVGTGCIMVARRVLEKIPGAFKEVIDDEGIPKWGTDFAFCRRAYEAGFKIWAAPNHVCEHIKEVGLLDITGHDDSDFRDRSNAPYKMAWGEFAISQKDWHFIKEVIQKVKPKRILEFGTGLSSLLMSEEAEVISYETERGWGREIKRKRVNGNQLKVRYWDGVKPKEKLKKFDLIFVDGPRGRVAGGMGRQHSIELASQLSDHVIVHDAGRDDEELWQNLSLKQKRFHIKSRSGYHQASCRYWKKHKPIKMEQVSDGNN